MSHSEIVNLNRVLKTELDQGNAHIHLHTGEIRRITPLP